MEKNRSTKIVAIAALFIAVIGLSIGFAAFSSTLTIHSAAEVNPDSNLWDIQFSTSSSAVLQSAGDITPTSNAVSGFTALSGTPVDPVTTFTASHASIDATNSKYITVSGVKAYFTDIGQEVYYDFYIVNNGAFDAYLRSVTFDASTAQGTTTGTTYPYVKCTPSEGVSLNPNSETSNACDGISLELTLNYAAQATSSTRTFTNTVSSITTAAAGVEIGKANNDTPTGIPVRLTVRYASGSTRADGPFTVDFGDIVMVFDAVQYAS